MKIAEVSVNLEALPSREDLIKLALNTKKYKGKHNALELINKEIDGTKLFQTVKPKRKRSKTED